MRKILSLSGLLVGAAAVVALGLAGPAAAAPAPAAPTAPDTAATAMTTPDKKSTPAVRTDATTQAHLDGVCEVYEFCLFTGNGFTGNVADFQFNDINYSDNTFAGTGLVVANNARSAFNGDPSLFVVGCIEPNYAGMCGFAAPFTGGDLLPDYFLNLESHYFTF